MEHIKALLIKFVLCTAMLFVVLGLFFGVDFGEVLTISVVLTGASYFIGDLWILPKYGNVSATIADFGLAFIVLMLLGGAIIDDAIPLFAASLISAAAIAIGEAFFHNYMANQVLTNANNNNNRQAGNYKDTDLRTEAAEETDVHDLYDPERAADEKEHAPEQRNRHE